MLMCIRRARETIEDVCLNITTESTMNYVNQMAPHATTAEITYTALHYEEQEHLCLNLKLFSFIFIKLSLTKHTNYYFKFGPWHFFLGWSWQ